MAFSLAMLLFAVPLAEPVQRNAFDVTAAISASGVRDAITSPDGRWTAMIFGAPGTAGGHADDSLWVESGTTGEMKCLIGRACGEEDGRLWTIRSVSFAAAGWMEVMAAPDAITPVRSYRVDPERGTVTPLEEQTAAYVPAD